MWKILLAGLVANEYFTWKVVHVDYRSVSSTVSVCSSVGLVRSVLCPNARFVDGRVAACRDAVREVLHLPLSYFATPRLGHVASCCAAIAGSPRSSAVLGR
ncbi:hypothetical protein TB2_014625 [Malus domestica]